MKDFQLVVVGDYIHVFDEDGYWIGAEPHNGQPEHCISWLDESVLPDTARYIRHGARPGKAFWAAHHFNYDVPSIPFAQRIDAARGTKPTAATLKWLRRPLEE
jgi:hypothetical protein